MLPRTVAARLSVSAVIALGVLALAPSAAGAATGARHIHLNCAESSLCTELADYGPAFGLNYYVGHDEPSAIFYSNQPGSGNRMRYTFTLPSDPSPTNPTTPGKSYNFELHGASWFGMAMCDTQSYPEQVKTCTPDSDSNIVNPRVSPRHPGTAFTELQFYPPGWVPWPTWAVAVGASSCDATHWCAALNVDSLSEDPVAGTVQNPTCAAKAGLEYINFAFVTHDGKSTGPANPLDATIDGTFTPNPSRDLFMNSGDRLTVTMHDTAQGLEVVIRDLTTGQSGSMTASPANGFAQIKFAPTGTECQAIPYAFHPMYSTSSPDTRVIWAAHTYNVGFSDEIGHWQNCVGRQVPATPFGINDDGVPVSCPQGNTEDDGEPAEAPAAGGDDNFCFPASEALLVHVQGCTDTNVGFDGVSYHPVWPDGNTLLHPTPIQFTSPLTGAGYKTPYSRAALEADLPRIESTCDRFTGTGRCTLIPIDDDGQPAQFYPYFSIAHHSPQACVWQIGGSIPGTTNDFGKNSGYGTLLKQYYLDFGTGRPVPRFNDFRNVFSPNPCPV